MSGNFGLPHGSNFYTGAGLFIAGALCTLGSIPYFIVSHNNKQKALRISAGIKMQDNGQLIQMYAGRYHAAVSLKINLK